MNYYIIRHLHPRVPPRVRLQRQDLRERVRAQKRRLHGESDRVEARRRLRGAPIRGHRGRGRGTVLLGYCEDITTYRKYPFRN